MFVGRAIAELGIGLAVGFAGAFGVGRFMRSMLIQTSPNGAVTLISISVMLVVVSVAASWLPAWRAARADPAVALRHE